MNDGNIFALLPCLTHIEFMVCIAAMVGNDNEMMNFFVFIPANSCEYEDVYSNCKQLKDQVGCENNLIKNSCKAACNCSNKTY